MKVLLGDTAYSLLMWLQSSRVGARRSARALRVFFAQVGRLWAVQTHYAHRISLIRQLLRIDVLPGLHYACSRADLCAEAATRASGGIGARPETIESRCWNHEP